MKGVQQMRHNKRFDFIFGLLAVTIVLLSFGAGREVIACAGGGGGPPPSCLPCMFWDGDDCVPRPAGTDCLECGECDGNGSCDDDPCKCPGECDDCSGGVCVDDDDDDDCEDCESCVSGDCVPEVRPTNFRQTSWWTSGTSLWFSYAWDSTSGDPSDLDDCGVGERVDAPGSANPYVWPNPPWDGSSSNPAIMDVPATWGTVDDEHGTKPFVTPYQAASVSHSQVYRFSCDCDGNQYHDLLTGITISRWVSWDSGTSKWKYLITKPTNGWHAGYLPGQ